MKILKYIHKLENNEEINSSIKFENLNNEFYKYLDDNKVLRITEKSHMSSDGKIIWEKILYKTTHPFFLYVNNNKGSDSYNLTIFYKKNKFNELLLFIKQIKHQLNII